LTKDLEDKEEKINELQDKVKEFEFISSRVKELEKLSEERDSNLADFKTNLST
jgi:hypothetical protein